MDLFLVGGTGVVGRPLLPLLVAAGHQVRVVVRSEDAATRVRAAGGRPVRLPSYTVDALAPLVEGCETVIDLTTSVPPLHRAGYRRAWREHDWLREHGTARVVQAAQRGGVMRVVRDSVTFLHADGGDGWIDEDWPLDPGLHLASAAAAEAHVHGFRGEGVVLRFALLYGPESAQTVATAALARRLGVAAVLGPAEAFQPSLHTDDAASAVLAALGAPPGTYGVSDGAPLRRRELVRVLAQTVGRRRLTPPPAALVRGAPGRSQMRSHRLSSARFREATGWRPQHASAVQGWASLAAHWEAERRAA